MRALPTPSGAAFPPPPAEFNLARHVLARAATLGDGRPALQILRPGGAERWSYARLEAAVRGAATGFLARGLVPGDRVLLRLGNTVEFPVAFLGAVAAGLIPVPTSAQLTRREITAIAAEIAPALVVAGAGVALPEGDRPLLDEAALRRFEALPPAPYATGDPHRPAYIVYTSGTSGRPRAVLHAHRAVWARRMMRDGWEGLAEGDRLLHAGAFNWTYTLGAGLMDPWAAGATALVPAEGVTAEQLPLLLRRFDATIFAAVPGVYRRILKSPPPALPRLRHALSAGEKLSETLRDAWRAATGTEIHEAMGLSECSTFVSGSPERPAPPGTLGFPQPGRRIAVLGPDGATLPEGEPGTLAVHRSDPGLFLGYLNAEEETKARFSGDWFLTGDTVALNEDGSVTYLGRGDDMMNAGGHRVSPVEVEAAFAALPAAGEVAAAELRVKAEASVVALFHTGPAGEAELAAHAAGCLARYKQPRLYIPVAAIPKTANGKLNRRALREEWEAGH